VYAGWVGAVYTGDGGDAGAEAVATCDGVWAELGATAELGADAELDE